MSVCRERDEGRYPERLTTSKETEKQNGVDVGSERAAYLEQGVHGKGDDEGLAADGLEVSPMSSERGRRRRLSSGHLQVSDRTTRTADPTTTVQSHIRTRTAANYRR